MSDSTAKEPEVVNADGDELIHVPTGQSRLRYLATIGLVLFLLIIFVVADLFQSTLTGGGGREDRVAVSWEDPISGEPTSVMSSKFDSTLQFLSVLASTGRGYYPPSAAFRDIETEGPLRRVDVTDEDAAAFLVWEDLADDAGIAIADQEHKDFLRGVFGTNDTLRQFAANAGLTVKSLSMGIRRVQRVVKLQNLILRTQRIPDSAAAVAQWQEDFPDFKFEVVSVDAEDFVAQAKDTVPADEELKAWFAERPAFERQRLFTQPRVVYEAAYVDLSEGATFDGAALLAAFPAAEGTDVEQLTRSYYDLNQRLRFMKPIEEPAEDDAEEGDEPQKPKPAPQAEPFDFEEVKDRARTESEFYAALGALLTELQDAQTAGEEFDFIARADELGLATDRGADEGITRSEILEVPGWGSRYISGQLSFAAEGTFVPRVVISENAMTIARAVTKIEAQEPPFEDIREEVVEMWAKEKASELAKETLDGLRETLVARPEGVEHADWTPVIEKEALRERAAEAQYAYYDRPALGRGEMPEDQKPADRFIQTQSTIYDLEDGQVGPAIVSADKGTVYLVRLDAKGEKPIQEIDVASYEGYGTRSLNERMVELGGKVFRGDSEWFTARTKLRFPIKEQLEADRAAEDAAEEAASGGSES